jgi:hypothetical protein
MRRILAKKVNMMDLCDLLHAEWQRPDDCSTQRQQKGQPRYLKNCASVTQHDIHKRCERRFDDETKAVPTRERRQDPLYRTHV